MAPKNADKNVARLLTLLFWPQKAENLVLKILKKN